MPYCSKCGYDYLPGAATCPDCGTPLEQGERVLCGACGEEARRDASFCGHCGTLLPWGAEATPVAMCSVHTDQPARGTCVICHRTLCGECLRIRNGRIFCHDDKHVKAAFNWVVACTTNTEQEAEMIKANLEGAGIGVFVLPQRDSMYVATVGNLAVVEVMVPTESLEDAHAFLHSLDVGEPPAASVT
jgi:hypothetical protein